MTSRNTTCSFPDILKRARRLHSQQVKWRRHLHRYPELSFKEYKTTAYLADVARKLGLAIQPIKMPTGLLAELRGGEPGPTVAIRTDMDALPVLEQTALSFRSRNDGCMHACGHDIHMAVVLGVAAVLSRLKETLPGVVRFIFQPGEEMPPGGARPMIENGALEDVDVIFGLHVDPTVPVGRIGLRDGVTMGSVTDFDLTIHGRGGHAARPHETVDAIAVASEVIQAIQQVVSREIDPITPVVVSFGRIEGGGARNVIADRVKLTGTARALSAKASKELTRRIERVGNAVCRARSARMEMTIEGFYPPLANHPEANRILGRCYRGLFPKGKLDLTPQVLGGEDFACYLERVRGAMFRLGIRNSRIGADKPWHSPEFVADEEALVVGTSLLAASVLDYLDGIAK